MNHGTASDQKWPLQTKYKFHLTSHTVMWYSASLK
jgi:hypothetical protein